MAGLALASAKSALLDNVKTRKRAIRRRALKPRMVLKGMLLATLAVFTGWLCVRAATVEALGRSSPMVAAKLAPHDPRVAIGFANVEFRAGQGVVSPEVSARAVQALQRAPLAHDPFFFAGLNSLVRGNSNAALPLIREARRRNPRSKTARLVYLDQVLRSGDTQEAAIEIAALSRLVPEASRVLVPELAKYAGDPKTADALIAALRPDPKLRDAVLEQLASSGADPDIILKLAASGPRDPETVGVPAWQGRMLTTLIEKGQIGRARTLWGTLAGVKPQEMGAGVYDGAFRGAAGPPPFNWKFAESAAGVAEPTKAPALQIEYYGRAEAELASQLLQLSPGRHTISMIATGSAPSGGGNVAWTLTCVGGKAPVAVVPIRSIDYKPRRLSATFAISRACPAQWLRLTGTPAEFPAVHSITVANLQVQRGQGS